MYASREVTAAETSYGIRDGAAASAGKGSHRWPIPVREHAVQWPHEPADGRLEKPGPELDVIDGYPNELPIQGHAADTGADESEDAEQPESPEDEFILEGPEDELFLEDAEDELFLLGERCAQAYMHADALHYQAMRLLAKFDRRTGWRDTGFSSTAEWLAWRIGIKPNAARERLRTALALEQLPQISEAMRNGELSFTKVRTLTRVATPKSEPTLLDFARAGSAANLERIVRGWKTLDRKSEVTAEQIRHRSRRFSAFVDDDGMIVVRGRLDPEVGALFMRAVEAASDALFRNGAEKKGDGGEGGTNGHGGDRLGHRGEDGESGEVGEGGHRVSDAAAAESGTPPDLDETSPEQRRADAVGLIAERAFAAGFGNGDGGEVVSGSRAERYQVMLHVDADTLKEDGDLGRSELEDGTRVTAVTSRRIACDSGLVTIAHAPDGEVIGAGRRIRTVNPSIRRALEARDRGCRFPGCGLRFTEAHHVKHWADGGETTLRNMALLCRTHHRAVHEGGVKVCIDLNGQVVFFTPKGKTLLGAPPRDWERLGSEPRPGKRKWAIGEEGAGNGGERSPSGEERPACEADRSAGPLETRPYHLSGASRWVRDEDIPWEVEAGAWDALEAS